MTPEQEAAARQAVSTAARLIGMLGASKGGKARAKSLDAYRRFEIASMGGRAQQRAAWLKRQAKLNASFGIPE